MPQIKLGPNRAYPSLPEPDGTSENTAEVLGLVKESLEIAQRRSGALQDSFVRVSDLSDLGFITYDSVSGIVETADDDSAIVSELSDLSDVGVTTPTNRNVLAADGDSWESRALVEADISDLGTYLTSVTAADVDSGAATNGQVLEADGLGGASWQTQAAGVSELSDLSDVGITTPTNRNVLVADGVDWDSRALIIADISDFTDNSTNWNTAYGWGDHAAAGYPSLSADEVVTGTWALDGPVTTSDFGTGGRVKDGTDTARPIGFNTMPVYAPGVNDAFDLAHNGMVWHNDTIATQLTFTCDNDSTIPVGATYVVTSTSSGGVIIAEGIGVTVKFMNAGAAPTEGNVTMEIGGILTVFKYSDTEFWVWGSKTAETSPLISIVEDTTPQLGGTLDANGNIIDMGVNTITDTKVGQWDTAYGWGNHSVAGYLSNVVEDLTPQLGGTLDANGNIIDMGVNTITDTKVGQWDTAYGWGDHSAAGYALLSGATFTGNVILDGPVTTSDFGTGGRVKDGTDTARPIGFNSMPVYEPGANDAFDLAHNGMVWHNGTVSTQLTFTCDNDSTIPVGATYVVTSTSSGGVIIAEGIGVTVKFMNAGAAPTEGNVTMEIGGILTVFKYSDTEFWVWGSKSAGSSGLTAVVDDATPQLGGTLDANGNIIDMGVNTITDTKVGQWDTAYGWGDHSAQNYALTTGDTFTGAVTVSGASGNLLTLSGASPQLYFNDTSASADDFWIHVNGNNFYVLTDRGDDGSWDSPHPLQLEADTNTGYLFGAKMPVVNAAETISAAWTFSSGLNIGSTSTTLSQLAAGKLGVEGKAVLQHAGAFTSGQVSIQSGGSPSGGSNGDIVLIY